MLKFTLFILSTLLIAPLNAKLAPAVDINPNNYKSFIGKSAYTIFGLNTTDPNALKTRYDQLLGLLDPEQYTNKEAKIAAWEARDMVLRAYKQIYRPGELRDYQLKLAEAEGLNVRDELLIGDAVIKETSSTPIYEIAPFEDHEWIEIEQLERIYTLTHTDNTPIDIPYVVQLLARAVMENRRAILRLQGTPEIESVDSSGHPELEQE